MDVRTRGKVAVCGTLAKRTGQKSKDWAREKYGFAEERYFGGIYSVTDVQDSRGGAGLKRKKKELPKIETM